MQLRNLVSKQKMSKSKPCQWDLIKKASQQMNQVKRLLMIILYQYQLVISKHTPPDLILDQAERELHKGNIGIAIQILLKIIEKWPTYYLAYNDLGIIHWKSGDKKQAFEYLKHAYEINPFDIKIVKNLGKILIYLQTNNYEKVLLYIF